MDGVRVLALLCLALSLLRALQRTSTPNGKGVFILRGQYALLLTKSRLQERDREREKREKGVAVLYLYIPLFLLFWIQVVGQLLCPLPT
jgi:hypothetical protein